MEWDKGLELLLIISLYFLTECMVKKDSDDK